MNPTERALVAACGCRYVQIFKTNSYCVTLVDIGCGEGIKCLFCIRNGESEVKNSGLQKDLALMTAGPKQVRTTRTWISRGPVVPQTLEQMLMSVRRL